MESWEWQLTNFWLDIRYGDTLSLMVTHISIPRVEQSHKVINYWNSNTSTWKWELLRKWLPSDILHGLAGINIQVMVDLDFGGRTL